MRTYITGEAMRLLRPIFIIICLMFIWSGPAAGIDKSKKDDKPAPEKKVQVEKKTPDKSQDKKGTKKNYDNFVDRNNNGIDDRAEKSSSKQPKKKTTPKPPPQKDVKP